MMGTCTSLDYRHLQRMSDKRGMLQSACGSIPDTSSGYTVDNNARALIVALQSEPDWEDRMDFALRYARFLYRAQRSGGDWCNWLLPGRGFVNDIDSLDSVGRAFLACSLVVATDEDIDEELRLICRQMIVKALPVVKGLKYPPRSLAYVLIGFSNLVKVPEYSRKNFELAKRMGEKLTNLYFRNRVAHWRWFEDRLTYCNAILPHSLFIYYSLKSDRKVLNAAQDSLRFLGDRLFTRGYLSVIGNRGWWVRGGEIPLFDQLPINACSLVMACRDAYIVTGRNEFRDMGDLAYSWYSGKNILEMPLYDPESGGCYDALTPDGLNVNQGADAVLSLLLSKQAMSGKKLAEHKFKEPKVHLVRKKTTPAS
jgi:hypothetical protein